MNTSRFIERIRAAGFSIEAQGDALAIFPASRLTAEQREFVRQHKTDILAELRAVRSSEAVLEPCQSGADIEVANDDAAELTGTERGALIAMGLRWGYTPEDWQTLWNACRDPEQRANWIRIAESEQPTTPAQEDTEPAVVIRVEADIGTGRKVFDLRVPLDRWNEQKFSEQIAAMPGAQFWRLDQPKRCADCRHAQPTQHSALVRCDQRDDAPSCGMWWADDDKPCQAWAPTTSTDIKIQEQRT